MIAEIKPPRFRYVPSPPPLTNCQPKPGPFTPPCAAAIRGLMILSVNALTRLLNAKATTSPTATTITSPRIRKFLKPLNIATPACEWTTVIRPLRADLHRAHLYPAPYLSWPQAMVQTRARLAHLMHA